LISTFLLTPFFLRQQKRLEPIDRKYLFFPLQKLEEAPNA